MNKVEERLYETKWFDYRILPVDAANIAFIFEFAKALSEYNKQLGFTGWVNPYFKKFDIENYKKWHWTRFLIKLRQYADRNSMRYDDFWELAFEAFNEFKFRKMSINFFLNEDALRCIEEKQKKKKIIKYASSRFFSVEYYSGFEIQDDYYWYLIGRLKNFYGKNWKRQFAEMVGGGVISVNFYKNNKSLLDK